MYQKTLTELSQLLEQKAVSSVELTEHFLERAAALDDQINSFITLCPESALEQACAADERRAKGESHPLLGMPLAQKDIFCTKGIKTTCGSKMLDNFIAPYDAFVINQFNQAGAVTLGKTNMDEFAMGSSNETSFYKPVHNPWDTNTVPGGSSGGTSAAVAARLAPGGTGTDTGGSIRQPAALTGITGLKPTYGRVSRYGMIAFASSLDQAGPMTQTAEDAALLLQTMAGFDPKDSTSIDEPVPDYLAALDVDLKGLKIGLPKEYFADGLDPEVRTCVEAALAFYESQGAILKSIDMPYMEVAASVYYVIAPAEASSNLSRFDGVRYGFRAPNCDNLIDLYTQTRAQGFGEEVKRRIMTGTYALSSGYYDAYYVKAQKIRRIIRDDLLKNLKEVDVIAGPTTPTPAFGLGAKSQDPLAMYLNDIYTIPANMAGLPGLSIPAGFAKSGLPIGLQFIGNFFAEGQLLGIAHQYQQATDWHKQIPKAFTETTTQ